jgi:pimeloyl-ACP methyl ester carboxylesterase
VRTRTRCVVVAKAALLLCALVVQSSVAAPTQAAELVTIRTNLTIVAHALQPPTPTPAAIASVVLLAGGNGVLDLDPSGKIEKLQGNFLIRSAYRFMQYRLNVAMLDAPDLTGIRLTEPHAKYVASALAAVRLHWPNQKKVWLVGTSNGTISAFSLAVRTATNAVPPIPPFADAPNGIVLASPIVQGAGETVWGTTPLVGTAKLKIPVLVVSHKGDPCTASDYALSEKFYKAVNSPKKAFVAGTGAMPAAAQRACDAFSYHGFHGIEETVVKKIADFISAF